jgi:hypothetical protein
MFEPIEAPDVHRGPATGHSTEFGTTWHEAVSRINAGFKTLFSRAEAAINAEFVERLQAAEARIGQFEKAIGDVAHLADAKFNDLEAKVDGHQTLLTAMNTPAEPPPSQPPTPAITSEPETNPALPTA